MSGLIWAIGAGALVTGGLYAMVAAMLPGHPRLGDALELLDGRAVSNPEPAEISGLDRIGRWAGDRLRRPVSPATRRRLLMAGRSIDRHYAYKAVGAAAGLAAPSLLGAALATAGGGSPLIPVAVGLALAVVGFVLPDVLLRAADTAVSADATEALLTYFDLVTLERLANRSGSQALRAAAQVSDITVFVSIREALERSRLQQRPPYAELQRLGSELELPALADIADVMALDESGAALSGALRARVKELRDAHLTQAKISAAAVSERMAFFMVIPSLVFGLFFLVPPILRLVGG